VELNLQRDSTSNEGTTGKLSVNGVWQCFTLELYLGDYGVGCAIHPGRYPVTMAFSPHFQMMLPHVNNVPGRTGILIHDGNTEKDTEGCILVGQERLNPGEIADSNAARLALQSKIANARANGEDVWLDVENPPVTA
jgi:hypothetical protein